MSNDLKLAEEIAEHTQWMLNVLTPTKNVVARRKILEEVMIHRQLPQEPVVQAILDANVTKLLEESK